jgi:hypothetical protein
VTVMVLFFFIRMRPKSKESLGALVIRVTNLVSAIIKEVVEYGFNLMYSNKRGNVDFEST